MVLSGALGLAAFAGGSLLAAVPGVGEAIDEVLVTIAARRTAILAGSALSVAGAVLLGLWTS